MIGSLLVTGYILFGKEFIKYWVGVDFYGAYIVGIVLMIPALIPLIQNVTNAILDAMMKRLGRSLILVAMSGVNIIVSIFCIRVFGYIGAAYGTAISYIIGNLLLINIYLHKVNSINLKQMYKELLKSFIVSIVCFLIGIPLSCFRYDGLWTLILKIGIYVIIYTIAMYSFAMRDYKKKILISPLSKIFGEK